MIRTMSQKAINNFGNDDRNKDDTDHDHIDEEMPGKMNKNDLKCNEKLIDVNKNIKDETDEEDDDDRDDRDETNEMKISSKNNKLIIDDDVICCDSDNDMPPSNGKSDNVGYNKKNSSSGTVEEDDLKIGLAHMEKDKKQLKEIMRAFRAKFNSLDGGKECRKEFVCDDKNNEIGINGNATVFNNNNMNNGNTSSSSNINCNLNSSSTKINLINNDNNDTVQDQTQFNQQTPFSMNKNEEFKFKRPPECPVFKPNEEEFKNPLTYISKVRSIAEKYGICKIIPPKTWTPPFTVDVDKLRFTPRVQRLNELEAKTRIKLNFLDQIAKFWELQGSSLKIPMVERKALDLYTLHRIVQEEGGMEQITKERKWSKIALRMHYPPGKSVGTILKGHYERILHPFDIFTSGKASVDLKLEPEINDKDYKPHGIVSRQQITPPNETTARRSKRFANSTVYRENGCGFVDSIAIKNEIKKENDDGDDTDDVKPSYIDCRRKFMYNTGGGGGQQNTTATAATMGCKSRYRSCSNNNNNSNTNNNNNGKKKRKIKDVDPFAKYICHICNRGDAEEAMLLCDGCDDSYHTFCLIPPLNDIPKGDWRCPKCVVEEVSKPVEAFGFEQAQREYTLQQFGEMADQFKADYFNMAVHLVPTTLVEREFWRIVSSIDEDVTVEYGADLHTMDHGSGFPTRSSLYLLPDDQEYAESSWNLNNLPLLEESILGHINADISGMKVPWMYVGMCFATFCWHNEDHWSYSINYLHWGEPKTWYGVPGSKAEMFEETMKSAAPELFQSQPDLLHQLVTIMNPNILMNAGVPVYRTDQHAGEFVITFPRAYHAGFNQGYNFAEAVNFAPADWMKMGRECINHYSTLRRFCVFSHDELVCKMALEPDKLNLGIATACYLDMVEMVDTEKKLRKSLLDWGVTRAEREAFELIPDDERQCESCKTTCFLSAVACSCTKSIVCLRHNTELCSCPPEKHTLKYRYTLDELPLMLKKLKVKAESFENWLSRVRDVLDPNTPTTITLDELQELAQEAETKKFPSSVLLERLNSAVLEAEKCVTVIQQLDINKMRTRTRNSCESAKYKLTLEELDMFVQEIDNLCCIIPEGQSVRELQILGKEFLENSKTLLSQTIHESDENELEQLITDSSSLCIELPQLKLLKERLKQVNWYNRIRDYRDGNDKLPLIDLQNLFKEGMELPPATIIEKELYELNAIILMVEEWEISAKTCFESGTQRELPEIELLLESGDNIQCELPSKALLKDAVKKSKEWLQTVETLQSNENYPYFHTLENVVNKGKNIPFELEELTRMEVHLMSARNWKDNTSRTFLKKHSTLTLMDVLSPRSDAVMINCTYQMQISKIKKKLLEEQFTEDTGPAQMVIAFKNAEEKELRDMRELRKLNMDKNPVDDKYCVCKRKFQVNMYHCQLCKDWFHTTCVPPPRLQSVRSRNNNTSSSAATATTATGATSTTNCNKDMDIKYLCQSCVRSRRPRLETILSLLVTLQSLPIRLPEGEALQCLTERAMNWQDRVRQAFSIEDISSALASLSSLSSNGGDKNDKTNHNNNSSNHKKSNRKSRLTAKIADIDFENDTTSSDDDDNNKNNSISLSSLPTKIEHAYSVPSSFNSNSQIPGTKGLNNSSSIKDGNYIMLTKSNKELLEDLMMEGDLLEVSLDETSHLWRILCATKPSQSDLVHINYRYSLINPSTDSTLVNTTKKRRSEDNAAASVPSKRTTKNNLTPASASDTNEANMNSATKMRRGRKLKMDTTKSNENTPSDNKRRKRGKKTKDKQSVAVASNSDDDEECSAANCERPAGREVDWVQCDGGCNKWFHMYCVGLDKHQIKPDDDYICKTCKSRIESAASANNNKRNSRGGGGDKGNNYNLLCDDIDGGNSNEDGGDESGEGVTRTATATTNPIGIDDDEDGNDDGDGDSNDGTTTNSNSNKQNDDNKTSNSASPSRKLTLSDDNSAMPSMDVKSTSDLSNLSDKNLTTNTGELLLFKNDDKNMSMSTTTATTTNQNQNNNNSNSECSNFSNNNSNFNENNNSNSSSTTTSCGRNKNFNSDSNNSTKSN